MYISEREIERERQLLQTKMNNYLLVYFFLPGLHFAGLL